MFTFYICEVYGVDSDSVRGVSGSQLSSIQSTRDSDAAQIVSLVLVEQPFLSTFALAQSLERYIVVDSGILSVLFGDAMSFDLSFKAQGGG